MKRLFILITLTLLLGRVQGWSAEITREVTMDPTCLRIDSFYVEGGMLAGYVQRLHVFVTNIGNTAYQGHFFVLGTGNQIDINTDRYSERMNTYVIEPAITEHLFIDMYVQQETPIDQVTDVVCKLNVTTGYKQHTELLSFNMKISPKREPRFREEMQVDMLERNEDGNILYGDLSDLRISGTITVTNEEDFPIFTYETSYAVSVVYDVYLDWVGDGTPRLALGDQKMTDELRPGETITRSFCFDFTNKKIMNEKEFSLNIWVLAFNKKSLRVPFTVKPGTNTYWTADQHVKPLPQEGMKLKVPKEAVAVDFRGNYGVDGIYTVDVTEANPNCLYYLNNLDYVPRGLDYSRLIIRNYAIRDLVIDERHDFYCPMPFEAKTALLTITPNKKFTTGKSKGTFTLPFDVPSAWLTDVNNYTGESGMQVFRFAGNRPDLTLLFEPVHENQLLAYEPYLYSCRYSNIGFWAENITVPATRPAVTHTQYFDFKGTTTAKSEQSCVPWSWEDDCFALDVNEYKNMELRPFTAAIFGDEVLKRLLYEMPTNPPVVNPGETSEDFTLKFPIAFLDAEENKHTDSIHQLQTPTPQPSTTQGVYSLTGQYLGRSGEVSLKPGLYVIDGKKRIVR